VSSRPSEPARIALFTGKGGVGKTTLATAAGISASGAGSRTLVLSTDPAHSLSDVLGVPLGGEPVEVGPLLWAAEVDVQARFEAAWAHIRDYLIGFLTARGVAEVAAEELVVLPGADEIVALLEVHEQAVSGRWDVIVVDCAPTGETLRLLALPETLAFYADRLFGTPQRLLRAIAAGVTGRGGRGPDAEVRDSVGELLDRLAATRTLLTAPGSGVTVVTTAERVVIAEARRAWTSLALHGYRVQSVIVNRLVPDSADGEWAARLRAAQQEQLAVAVESFSGLSLHLVPLHAAEPVGLSALGELAAQVFRGAALPSDDAGPDLRVGGADGRYTLTLTLPLVERGQVQLSRARDDLVVTVGSQRRRIALPSLLQRCNATGARFEEGALVVDFVPDPSRWPALVGV
jgi:arsenite/tail-anchored protein-transporting ATPase